MPTDIFDTPLWPSDKPCLIVGSGPNLNMVDGLNSDNYGVSIILNKAITALEGDFWLCSALGLLQEDWFKNEAIVVAPWRNPVFMNGPLVTAYPQVPFTFHNGTPITQEQPCTEGVLHSGVTVAGRALQLAYLKGSRDIILAGVDFMGNEYFDDTINEKRGHGPWGALGNINMLVEWLGKQGCRVRSLTPTAITVEMMK